jgi:choline kinase
MLVSVLLASGVSSRFQRDTGLAKQLALIDGLPLMCYPVTSLSLAGASELIVVVNTSNRHVVSEAVNRCPYYSSLTIYVDNYEVWRDNGYSALVGLERAVGKGEPVLVSMTDHIYPSSVPESLIGFPHALVLGGDSSPSFADVGEATKIAFTGRGYVFSKSLESFNFVDIGVHKLPQSPFYGVCLESVLPLSRLLTCISHYLEAVVFDVNGTPWIDIDTYHDYLEALRGKYRRVVDAVWEDWEGRGLKR